jgi:phage terminase small subunit
VVAELAKLAFANMLDFVSVGDDGLPRVDLKRLSREDGAAIQSLTVDYWRAPVVRKRDRKEGEGTEKRRPGHVPTVRRVRIQLADKRAALMDLARHLGIAWPDQAEAPEPIIKLIRVATGVPRAGDEELLERQRLEELKAMGRY